MNLLMNAITYAVEYGGLKNITIPIFIHSICGYCIIFLRLYDVEVCPENIFSKFLRTPQISKYERRVYRFQNRGTKVIFDYL